MKSLRILGGWTIAVAVALFSYVIYKLVVLGWFVNVTIPTLLFTSIFVLAIVLALNKIVRYFFSKETK